MQSKRIYSEDNEDGVQQINNIIRRLKEKNESQSLNMNNPGKENVIPNMISTYNIKYDHFFNSTNVLSETVKRPIKHRHDSSAKIGQAQRNVFLNIKKTIIPDRTPPTKEKEEQVTFFNNNGSFSMGLQSTISFSSGNNGSKDSNLASESELGNYSSKHFPFSQNEDDDEEEENSDTCSSFSKMSIRKKTQRGNERNYRQYGLRENSEYLGQRVSPDNTTHRFLPDSKKDNEKYKIKLFQFLRKPEHSDSKTETCKHMQYRKHSALYGTYISYLKLDGNLTKFYNLFDFKKRKINSEKKIFESLHPFQAKINGENVSQYFKIYADKDIGISSRWQQQLKETVFIIFNI